MRQGYCYTCLVIGRGISVGSPRAVPGLGSYGSAEGTAATKGAPVLLVGSWKRGPGKGFLE